MAAENLTREEHYIKEIKSNLENALLTINNLSIQLSGLTRQRTENKVAYARTSGYVNWGSIHDSIATKQWQPISEFTYYCASIEKDLYNVNMRNNYFHTHSNRKFVDQKTRFPSDQVYVNISNPIVGAELLYIRDCNTPEPGLLRNFINIANSDSHTRNSFEEKYGLIWVDPCDRAVKESINDILDTPVKTVKEPERPMTSSNANEPNLKPASEVLDILKEKPDTSEREQAMQTSNTKLTKEFPDSVSSINKPASNPDNPPDFFFQNGNKAEAILKQETDMQTCSAETSNAADDADIKSANTETDSLLKDKNLTVIINQKQAHLSCIPVQVSYPVGVSDLLSDSDKKSIRETILISEKPKDVEDIKLMSHKILKEKPDTSDREQAMETSNTELTKESPDSISTINKSALNPDVVSDLPLQDDNNCEAVLNQETNILTCLADISNEANEVIITSVNRTVTVDKKQEVQVLNPESVTVCISDSNPGICPFLISKNEKDIVDLKQVTETNALSGNVANAVKASIFLDDSIKILSVPNLFSTIIDKCPENLTKKEQPQELCPLMSEQELNTDSISSSENDENLNVIKKQEPFLETCNKMTVLVPVPVNERTTDSIMLLEPEIPDSLEDLKSKDNLLKKKYHDEILGVMPNTEQLTETFKNIPDILSKNSNDNTDLTLNNEILSEDASQELYAKFRDILNNLTILNVNTMVDKIHTLKIKNEKELIGLTDIFFDKVLEDPDYAKLYADLTRKLSTLKVFYDNDPIIDIVSFRSCVFKKCQNIFESRKTDVHVKKDKERADTNVFEAMDDEESNLVRSKVAANIKFIGELYMVKYMPYKILLTILEDLISYLDETDLECACELLIAVGKQLECDSYRAAPIFEKMQGIVDSETNKISKNVKRKIQNVIELKKNRWVNLNKDVIISLPKTMEEFQKEAEARTLNIMMMNACGSRTSGNHRVQDLTNYSIKALKQQYLTQETLDYIKIPPICFQNIAKKMFEKFQANSRPDHLDYRQGMLADKHQDQISNWEESYLSKTTTRIYSNTSNELFKKSTRHNTHVAKPMSMLTDIQIRLQVRAAISEYQNHQCDDELVLEVKQNYLDCQHASVINEIVSCALEKVGKEFHWNVKYLFVLIATETVAPENFECGLLETFLNAPDLLIDIPLLYSLLAKLLAPHIVKDFVTISKLFELSENIISSNQGNMFLKELVIQLNENIGCSSVAHLWRESGLKLSQWMPEEDVEEWIFVNGFDFLDECSDVTNENTSVHRDA